MSTKHLTAETPVKRSFSWFGALRGQISHGLHGFTQPLGPSTTETLEERGNFDMQTCSVFWIFHSDLVAIFIIIKFKTENVAAIDTLPQGFHKMRTASDPAYSTHLLGFRGYL
ncbi:hypothetical protein NPIL_496401 [Nephila pilipes]|uniref:Uncharacterized protein n=1 Tax=Nephila pilipes TaxID=299642 RepID=A0A8X6TNF5_NEPPI|nr:hypothetical protein NPIL_496401 [Nephila pilipes]